MSISIPGRVVVFDYGEVVSVTPPESDRDALLALAGLASDADRFWEHYWAHRHDLDRGTLGTDEYWRLLADELGTEWDAARRHELWAADFRGWISVEPGTVALIEELREGGTRVALLSNAGPDFGGPLRFSPLGTRFERVFVSGELGLLKPDAEIYLHVAAELGVAPADLVFVDNRQDNVDGAEAVGITGHRFVGVPELRAFLEGLAG